MIHDSMGTNSFSNLLTFFYFLLQLNEIFQNFLHTSEKQTYLPNGDQNDI